MPQGDYEVLIRIERDTLTRTASGGETRSESTVESGLRPTRHYHGAAKITPQEGTGAAGGPGRQTVTEVFFKFQPPFPAIAEKDRIVEEVAGTEWTVRRVRSYARTMQVDVDKVA